jgi:hypothetical protein
MIGKSLRQNVTARLERPFADEDDFNRLHVSRIEAVIAALQNAAKAMPKERQLLLERRDKVPRKVAVFGLYQWQKAARGIQGGDRPTLAGNLDQDQQHHGDARWQVIGKMGIEIHETSPAGKVRRCSERASKLTIL